MQARLRKLFVAMVPLALHAGCATTTVRSSGLAPQQPLCVEGQPRPSAALYWKPQWRADQKEPQAREALARRGIERFVAQQRCLAFTEVERWPDAHGAADDEALVRRAGAIDPPPVLVLRIVVRELGPRLLLGPPALVEGGTEVVIDTRVLRLAGAQPLVDLHTQWRNGGAFVVRGVRTLDADLSAALSAVLRPAAADTPAPRP